jgi:hypothetical protein
MRQDDTVKLGMVDPLQAATRMHVLVVHRMPICISYWFDRRATVDEDGQYSFAVALWCGSRRHDAAAESATL